MPSIRYNTTIKVSKVWKDKEHIKSQTHHFVYIPAEMARAIPESVWKFTNVTINREIMNKPSITLTNTRNNKERYMSYFTIPSAIAREHQLSSELKSNEPITVVLSW